MDDTASTCPTSSRKVQGVLTSLPIAPTGPLVTSPNNRALTKLTGRYGDRDLVLTRTKEGRRLSRARYRRAEDFFPRDVAPGADTPDFFYKAGVTTQLALSSHLLDVGFPDEWCARHIGLRVAHALAYSNATGFNHHCPDMERLALVLNPYWKWNMLSVSERGLPSDGGFTFDDVRTLLRSLFAQVRKVTGHRISKAMRDYETR